MNKTLWIAVVVVTIIAIVGWVLPFGKNGQTIVEKLGAVSTLDGIPNPYVSLNGLREYWYRQAMTATSSVPCAIKNPLQATSTVDFYSANVTNNGMSATALTFDISTSSTAYASSSPAFVRAFSSGTGQFSLRWTANATSTNTYVVGQKVGPAGVGDSDIILGPNDYLTLKIATTSAGTYSSYWTGACQAKIRKL